MFNPYYYFNVSTIGMLLERASHNDDESYEVLASLTIDNVYADQMDCDGNIYDALILCPQDAEENQDFKFGHKNEFKGYFDSIMEMLKGNGYLLKYYEENKFLDLDECMAVAERENLISLIH